MPSPREGGSRRAGPLRRSLAIDWLDRRRTRPVESGPLVRFLHRLSRELPLDGRVDLGVTLIGDGAMRRLNRRWRGQDRTTDVLSFPADASPPPGLRRPLGDIVISVPQAARQAKASGHALGIELRMLLAHGYLHLLGYDHETDDGTMMRLQERLLRKLLPRERLR